MKYYSEKLGKLFDTPEELKEKEAAAAKAETEKAITKARLAKNIEDADNALNSAYDALEIAKKKVEELQKEYDKKVDDILNPAIEEVKKCNEKKVNAIKTFNKVYGPYKTTYTGDRATREWCRTSNLFENLLRDFWR